MSSSITPEKAPWIIEVLNGPIEAPEEARTFSSRNASTVSYQSRSFCGFRIQSFSAPSQ